MQPEGPLDALKGAVEALGQALDEESAAIRNGDFGALPRLQAQKRTAMRQLERSVIIARPSNTDAQELRPTIAALNQAIERNMRVLKAAREAILSVQTYAMQAIEARNSDGLYGGDGSVRRPQRLSMTSLQVKL